MRWVSEGPAGLERRERQGEERGYVREKGERALRKVSGRSDESCLCVPVGTGAGFKVLYRTCTSN